MPRKASSAQNTLVQATVFKKCDRSHHNPDSNKGCAAGTCQHTCEPAQVGDCPHKWTVRYSVSSRQREQSFGTLTARADVPAHVSTGKQTQGAMFTDPRAGIVEFLPLCGPYIDGMAKAGPRTKAIYRSNFSNPAVTRLLRGKSVLEVARMDAEVKHLLNTTLGRYQDEYRGNVRRVITGTLDECVRRGTLPRHTLTGMHCTPRISSKNTSLSGTGGWWLSVPCPLTSPSQRAKGARSANTTLQTTSHPKNKNQSQKQKSRSKSKTKGKTIQGHRSSRTRRLDHSMAQEQKEARVKASRCSDRQPSTLCRARTRIG